MDKRKKILIIAGQTATDKTNLGVYLAKKFSAQGGGELLSFDSRQAYRYLDIVTGKISKIKYKRTKRQIKNQKFDIYWHNKTPIWLYDLVEPKEYLTAYEFCQKAEIVIENILKRGKLPIIVGGTVFYIKSLIEGLDYQVSPDWQLREKLEPLLIEELQEKLKKIDRERFLKMNQSDRKNKRRLTRAIEISKIKNKKLKIQIKNKKKLNYLFLALILAKKNLREKIEQRVKKRIKMGAVREVENLLKKAYTFEDPGLNTIGYKQLRGYFDKKISLDQAVQNWIKAELDYARRQLVFLKKIKKAIFLDRSEKDLIEKTEELVYKWYRQ